jgi:hypothetical protein
MAEICARIFRVIIISKVKVGAKLFESQKVSSNLGPRLNEITEGLGNL